jgi:aminopeptidase N
MGARRSWKSRLATMLGGLALLCVAPATALADDDDDRRACVAGAPGVGDAYFPGYGNGGYDVRAYDLDVEYDPATDRLDGEAGIEARATEDLCSLNLDLVGLEVERVEVDGRRARWTRDGQELVVTPRRPLREGRRFEVEVRYGGVPMDFTLPGTPARSGFMTTPDGVTVAGQPEVAAFWFPVNDHPLDKATYTFEVTVPDGYEVVANGFLRDVDHSRGSSTWEWEAREPMASYLATIDVGQWDVRQWRTASGIPVYDAVDSAITGGLRAVIDASLARQGEILDVLGDAFGPYPFSTVGAIVDNQDDLFFALETQTRPVYSKYFWDPQGPPGTGDDVVVHELAHQWFGDDRALGRWQDIWLNEGFATYAEWLWVEHEAQGTPRGTFEALHGAIAADNPLWSVVIGDPGVDNLFDNAVYVRGAMTLQALRDEVGDDDFWTIIRTWAADRSGDNVTTPEFIALAERVAGRELDDLFATWLFTAGKPALPAASRGSAAASTQAPAAAARSGRATAWLDELGRRLRVGRY